MKTRLGRSAKVGLARRAATRSGVVLLYHRVGDPPGDPRYELVPALGRRPFEAQLDYLAKTFRVVAPSRLLEAAIERRARERFPLAITFDDDLRSHVDVAAPELQRRELRAGFFVTGGAVTGGGGVWWDDLQALADNGQRSPVRLHSLPELDLGPVVRGVPGAIHRAAETIERLPVARLDAVAAELRAHARRSPQGLTASELQSLMEAGFEVGFHTRRHHLLTKLDDEALATAMTEGRAELERALGKPFTAIAYPHGKADARVAEAARSSGYAFGFTGYPTSAAPGTDPLMIGRVEVTSASLGDFARAITAALAADE